MSATSNRIAGTAFLTVDGTSYALVGEMEYNPGIVTRESLLGQDGVHGYKEMPQAPHISATIRDMNNMDVLTLNQMTNNTITVQLANGKLIVGRNMWTVESQTSKAQDGTIEVKWEGQQGAVTEN
jgi:hypothetical protein